MIPATKHGSLGYQSSSLDYQYRLGLVLRDLVNHEVDLEEAQERLNEISIRRRVPVFRDPAFPKQNIEEVSENAAT